jgi:outer membrane protein assembly factor BamE (lipoprotein component of BamABCDE complex)
MLSRTLRLAGLLVLAAIACAGCLSVNIGDVSYSDGGFNVILTNEGNTTMRIVRMTVYETRDFEQHQIFQKSELVSVKEGTSRVFIPANLTKGTYKVYLSIATGDEQRYTVIRDVRV